METFSEDLLSTLPGQSNQWYSGELLSQSEFFKLNIFHIIIKDCDDIGNLMKGKHFENYIFIRVYIFAIGHKNDYFLSCGKCNSTSWKSLDAMYRSGFNNKLVDSKKLQYCSHCTAAETLKPHEIFDIVSQVAPFHFTPDARL